MSPAGSGVFKETYRAADNQAESHSDEDVDGSHAGESSDNGDVGGPGLDSFCCLVHVEGLENIFGQISKFDLHFWPNQRTIEYEIIGEGSQISTNQKRANSAFSLLIGQNLRPFPDNFVLYRVRYSRGRVSNYHQSEARKHCIPASDWLKFVTLPQKYRNL